jgi:hypothetical protein
LLRGTQSRLARFDPGAPVGDGRQFATTDTAEEAAIRGSAELVDVHAQKPRQLRVGGHDAAVSLGPVLELSHLAHAAIVGPLAARIGRRAAKM